MKKSIILLIISIVALCIPMHAQHMKFMGIPLTGTITQFQSKLTAKGVKYDKTTSGILPTGVRAYTGTFAGQKADFYVYYESSSKIVYRAKAVIGCISESICEQVYSEMLSMLSTKYSDAYTESGYQDGHETCLIVVSQEGQNELRDILGTIGLYVVDEGISYPFVKRVHVDYTDYQNSNKSEESKMKDL